MLGFYYCQVCGCCHDEWYHAESLMVCTRCKCRKSVRYNSLINGFIKNPVEMVCWTMSKDICERIVELVDCHPFDMYSVRRIFLKHPEMWNTLKRDMDGYIRFAYCNFEFPQDTYDRLTNEGRIC